MGEAPRRLPSAVGPGRRFFRDGVNGDGSGDGSKVGGQRRGSGVGGDATVGGVVQEGASCLLASWRASFIARGGAVPTDTAAEFP